MILSGPKACRGSTNEARICEKSMSSHSQLGADIWVADLARFLAFTAHRGGKRIVDTKGHLESVLGLKQNIRKGDRHAEA